jgi:hypothetical protein
MNKCPHRAVGYGGIDQALGVVCHTCGKIIAAEWMEHEISEELHARVAACASENPVPTRFEDSEQEVRRKLSIVVGTLRDVLASTRWTDGSCEGCNSGPGVSNHETCWVCEARNLILLNLREAGISPTEEEESVVPEKT